MLIDTRTACPDLNPARAAGVRKLIADAKKAAQPEAERVVAETTAELVSTRVAAGETVEQAKCAVSDLLRRRVLGPDVVLEFAKLGLVKGVELMKSVKRFKGEYLVEPVEGIQEGKQKAIVNCYDDEWPWIYSFAHGGIRYDFRHNFASLGATLRATAKTQVAKVLARLRSHSDLNALEEEEILELAIKLGTIKKISVLKRAIKEVMQSHRKPVDDNDNDPHYTVVDGELCWLRVNPQGVTVPTRLCNFDARIEEERSLDDGQNITKQYRLGGTLANGAHLSAVNVPVSELSSRGWHRKYWPADAVVVPTVGDAHLVPALQSRSTPVPKHTVYVHLGWRKIDGEWLYFHADGAIGRHGSVEGYTVEPGGALQNFVLEEVTDVKAAVRASLAFFTLGRVGITVIAAVFRAPLCEFLPADTSVFLAGATGNFKSALLGTAQAHYGAHWGGGRNFAANWSSTANALEKIAFIAKDCLLVIDDFCPVGGSFDQKKEDAKADRVLRAQGNASGRQRMNADSSLRDTYWPRGLIIATGEDVPGGQSLRARIHISQVERGSIDSVQLAGLQRDAAKGLMSQSMTAYVAYLARDAATLTPRLTARYAELCREVSGDHTRTPGSYANLMLGVEYLLAFALDVGAVDVAEASALRSQATGALTESVSAQDAEQAVEKPQELYREMVDAALAAGRCHLTTKEGKPPDGREHDCGWRTLSGGEYWRPQGDQIGWIDGDTLRLIPAAAYAAAERMCRDQNRSLSVKQHTLGKRMADAGWLLDRDRGQFSKQFRVEGGKRKGYLLSARQFLPSLRRAPVVNRVAVSETPVWSALKSQGNQR